MLERPVAPLLGVLSRVDERTALLAGVSTEPLALVLALEVTGAAYLP